MESGYHGQFMAIFRQKTDFPYLNDFDSQCRKKRVWVDNQKITVQEKTELVAYPMN